LRTKTSILAPRKKTNNWLKKRSPVVKKRDEDEKESWTGERLGEKTNLFFEKSWRKYFVRGTACTQ